uniref:Regulatory protein zeste n=1 Tax=Zeugodacus cucurbitae TaxID=28588 RepID=A0A0A1XC19_ZEUCU
MRHLKKMSAGAQLQMAPQTTSSLSHHHQTQQQHHFTTAHHNPQQQQQQQQTLQTQQISVDQISAEKLTLNDLLQFKTTRPREDIILQIKHPVDSNTTHITIPSPTRITIPSQHQPQQHTITAMPATAYNQQIISEIKPQQITLAQYQAQQLQQQQQQLAQHQLAVAAQQQQQQQQMMQAGGVVGGPGVGMVGGPNVMGPPTPHTLQQQLMQSAARSSPPIRSPQPTPSPRSAPSPRAGGPSASPRPQPSPHHVMSHSPAPGPPHDSGLHNHVGGMHAPHQSPLPGGVSQDVGVGGGVVGGGGPGQAVADASDQLTKFVEQL